ncbi:MAG: hypothetical protein FRX48_08890 [Lasallia pustulata]|uniref:Uncharacterized protein n=1 Tax=Lasallia pustulata TaxID=136370 RepID=A0A5M8PF41_9LECA|nr:MAG: hypothetical protein FRX48_08890 [Lasallia pustulata]
MDTPRARSRKRRVLRYPGHGPTGDMGYSQNGRQSACRRPSTECARHPGRFRRHNTDRRSGQRGLRRDGEFYQIPEQVISDPVNLVLGSQHLAAGKTEGSKTGEETDEEEVERRREEKGKGVLKQGGAEDGIDALGWMGLYDLRTAKGNHEDVESVSDGCSQRSTRRRLVLYVHGNRKSAQALASRSTSTATHCMPG